MGVDADGDSYTEHVVTAIGYDNATMEYAIYNTWDHEIHWYPWHIATAGQPYGILEVILIRCFSQANVIHVPADYPNIQAAIDASSEGDTILVADGIYTGNGNRYIYLDQKSVVITSENGPHYTTIDCGSASYAFYVSSNVMPYTTINGFTIKGAGSGDYYGAIVLWDSHIKITNNIIRNNYGNAIRCEGYYCAPQIINNTICSNGGSGIRAEWYAQPLVENTIVWENEGNEIQAGDFSAVTVTYSLIRKGYAGAGNIRLNPMFADIYGGDANVFSNSPCIDAGNPGEFDPDGTRRDIGVYYPAHPDYADGGRLIYVAMTGSDYSGDGSALKPYGTIKKGLKVSRHGDTVMVMPGIYNQPVNFYGHNAILASRFLHSGDFADVESTILTGNNARPVIRFESYENNIAAIRGFTITNGLADNGGGIYCFEAGPIIANCIIKNNHALYEAGGIYIVNASPTLRYNTIFDNHADWYGGGISASFTSATIDHCTFTGNSGNEMSGAIYSWRSDLAISNSIFWGDIAPYAPEIYAYAGIVNVNSCDITGGYAGDNINCDPQFCDYANNIFTVNNCSPCAYAGNDGFNIGAREIACGGPKTYIVPYLMHIKWADMVNPMTASIYLGNFYGDYEAGDIDPSSFVVNDSILPLTAELIPSAGGFYGPVWKLDIKVKGLIKGYGPVWDTTIMNYTVAGLYDNTAPFLGAGTVSLVGHKSGDLNYDGLVNVLDVIFLIDAEFRLGPPPSPPESADFNCDGIVNILDVLMIVNHVFKGGPQPPCP